MLTRYVLHNVYNLGAAGVTQTVLQTTIIDCQECGRSVETKKYPGTFVSQVCDKCRQDLKVQLRRVIARRKAETERQHNRRS